MHNYINIAVLKLSIRRTLTNPRIIVLLLFYFFSYLYLYLPVMPPSGMSSYSDIEQFFTLLFYLQTAFLIYSGVEIFDLLKLESLHFFLSKSLTKRQYLLSIYAGIFLSVLLLVISSVLLFIFISSLRHIGSGILKDINHPLGFTMAVLSEISLVPALFLFIATITNSRLLSSFFPIMLFSLLMLKYAPNPNEMFAVPLFLSIVIFSASMIFLWGTLKVATRVDI